MQKLLRRFRVGTRLWAILGIGFIGFVLLGSYSLATAFGLVLDEREQGAAYVVESAVTVAERYAERAEAGELTEAEARDRAADAIRHMRYNEYGDGSREYVWIMDRGPEMVMHPVSPELEGQNLHDLQDDQGQYFIREALDVVEADGAGFVEYLWPMPGEDRDEPVAKSTYFEVYEPWDWVVASGVYLERGRADLAGFAMNFAGPVVAVLAVVVGFVFLVIRSIVAPLTATSREIQAMTGNPVDLTREIRLDGQDEVTEVAQSVNALTQTSRKALRAASEARDDLQHSAQTLSAVTEQATRGIERQRSESEELATAMNEMVSTVQEVARNTNSAADSAREAEEATSNGRRVVEQTVEAIQDLAHELERTQQSVETLSGESEEIRSIVAAINEITEQTNLLALNAAIEAARAGESGRGFAVVADEVRKLSGRTQESTQQIQEIAERFQRGSQEAVERMSASSEKAGNTVQSSSQAGDSLNAITQAVSTISDLNTQIASAAEQQASTAEEINRNVVNIRDVANETHGGVQQIAEAAERQRQLVERLQEELGRIRYD